MDAFASLLERLLLTPARSGKLALLRGWFRDQPDPERGWGLAALTGELKLRHVKASLIRELIEDQTDPILFRLSYDYVGDLAETVSLLWPHRVNQEPGPELSSVIEGLSAATRKEAKTLLSEWLDVLDPKGRWALLKLATGGLRVGVSSRMAKRALAEFGHVQPNDIEEIWHGLQSPYTTLFDWLEGTAGRPTPDIAAPFRPVMLAHALIPRAARTDDSQGVLESAVTLPEFAAEWKYDGIRVQAVAEGQTRRLYTRTGDDISHGFPDVLESLNFDGTVDGELLIKTETNGVAPFSALQKRLNRKTVSTRLLKAYPAFILAYDLLIEGQMDLRTAPFRDRRRRLETFLERHGSPGIGLSPLIEITDLEMLDKQRNHPPLPEIEGVMLKKWDSPYLPGRPKGYWYKWKRDPFLIDAVLIYAQRGHGRRSSYYSDFTFGVWRTTTEGRALTPIGKAYSGFTDEELRQMDKFVRNHTTERFGPVRAVLATEGEGLVVELAFEGLQRSSRHKSGLALRFPRIHRIRWDKPTAEADNLETLESLLANKIEPAASTGLV